MENLIVCSKCGIEKKQSDFWYDKRRGNVRKPCISCSSKRSSLTNRLRYANNIISRSDVINHYKGKGLSDDVLNFFTDLIILNRNIKKMEKPLVKSDGDSIHIFCPCCAEYKSIQLPCGIDNLVHILNNFKDLHKHDDFQRT